MFYLLPVIIIALLLVIVVFWKYSQGGLSKEIQKHIKKKWNKCVLNEKDRKKAILEADKILDFTLKNLQYEGSLGEKLKKSKTLFSDLNGTWMAHKLRNKIAHEIDFELSENQRKKAIRQFTQALQDLGISV